MQEYLSEAIVLHSDPQSEFDMRFTFFTKRFGKISAKAKSVRKITSKLAGHLDSGTVAQVRIIEKSGPQVVDSLKKRRLDLLPNDLKILSRLLPEGEPDMRLWTSLIDGKFTWLRVLNFLGWDPEYALCRICGRANPEFFEISGQEFVCEECKKASRIPQNALLYVERNAQPGI